jgi:hypothetical protein
MREALLVVSAATAARVRRRMRERPVRSTTLGTLDTTAVLSLIVDRVVVADIERLVQIHEQWQQQSASLFLSSLSRPDPHAVVHLCRDKVGVALAVPARA